MEPARAVADAPPKAKVMGVAMASMIGDEVEFTADIDMDRIVADADYRRRVIARLRRERMLAASHTVRDDDIFDAAADED